MHFAEVKDDLQELSVLPQIGWFATSTLASLFYVLLNLLEMSK